MQGYSETVAVEVRVFQKSGGTLTFGVSQGGGGWHRMQGLTAPTLSVAVSRQIGRGGNGVFVLPGLSETQTGSHWVDLISLGDWVQIDATVQRAPGSQRDEDGLSHSWRTLFFGRVLEVEESEQPDGDGFAFVTTVTADDFLGGLEQPHFSYWRKLGATFGSNGDLREKLNRLDRFDLGEENVTAPTIAVGASIVLEAFIEGRIDIRRKLGKKDVDLKDTYGFRFESDGFQTGAMDLNSLAPEAQSWKGALEEIVDGPVFYEMFQDSLKVSDADTRAPDSDEVGGSSRGQARSRRAKYKGRGDYAELLVIRPAPFPTYRDEIDGSGNPTGKSVYSDAAWNALPLIECAPFAHGNLKVKKSRTHLKTVFSVNIQILGTNGAGVTTEADSNAQIVADMEKLLVDVGYDPLDIATKRLPASKDGQSLSNPQLSRALGWQLFSFNHLNDLYLDGSSSIPVDLRVQLGARWREADYLFYTEGYVHTFTPEAATTSLTLSRGLMVEAYGLKPTGRKTVEGTMNYVRKYLGRKRPGETLTPQAAQGIMNELNIEAGAAP